MVSPLRLIGEGLDALGQGISNLIDKVVSKANQIITSITDSINNLISTIREWFTFKEPELEPQPLEQQRFYTMTDGNYHESDGGGSLPDDTGVVGNFFVRMFRYTFIPSPRYLELKFNDVKSVLEEKMGIDNYTEFMDRFKGASGGNLEDVKINIMGVSATIINFSVLNSVKTTIHGFVRGIMFVLLVLYNLNQVYFLIRGTSLVGIVGRGDKGDN